jgi:hypothetical protein
MTPDYTTIVKFQKSIVRMRTTEVEIWHGGHAVLLIERVKGKQTRYRIALPLDPDTLRQIAAKLTEIAADIGARP